MTGRPSGRCAATKALERIAATGGARGCNIIYGSLPKGATCLDRQAHAADPFNRYSEEFRVRVLAPDYPCAPCQARAALASPCCVSADQEQVKEVHRLVVEADLLVSERNIGRQDYRLNKIEDALDRAALILLALLGSQTEEEER